jgi:hypothetical protein
MQYSIKFSSKDYYKDDAMRWCGYLSKTVEPKVLFYNRLAKCGSTTMFHLLRLLARRNDFQYMFPGPGFYFDLDDPNHEKSREQFIQLVNGQSVENDMTVVIGHFWQADFANDTIEFDYEYIQLVRECRSRRRSAFLYTLHNYLEAEKALKANESSSFLQHNFNITADPERCMHDIECLRNKTALTSTLPYELSYVCGPKCNEGYEEPYKSLLRVREPNKLTVLGVLENMTAYLEMLECAYPTFLRNISDIYNELNEVRESLRCHRYDSYKHNI